MSTTLLLWLALFVVLSLLAVRRPSWGIAVYMLTYFASPPFWWWGRPIGGFRWNLYGGIILLISVLIHPRSRAFSFGTPLLILLNATLVHFLIASNSAVSMASYSLLAKFVLLYWLMLAAVRDHTDLRVVLYALILGSAYIGFEITINEAGSIVRGRLEGVGAPGASNANELGALLATVLPINAYLFLCGKRWEKVMSMACGGLTTNAILLCNSRGVFLGCIAATLCILFFIPKADRKKLLPLCAIGALGLILLLGDPRIIERFSTTFAEKEERDKSASSRLLYWQAAINLISDRPLGSGGNGFKRKYGPRYLSKVGVHVPRSIHNGYLNEACEWGVQGLVLRIIFLAQATLVCWRITQTDSNYAVLGAILLSCLAAFAVTSLFGDRLDAEWGYWIPCLALAAVPLARDEDRMKSMASLIRRDESS